MGREGINKVRPCLNAPQFRAQLPLVVPSQCQGPLNRTGEESGLLAAMVLSSKRVLTVAQTGEGTTWCPVALRRRLDGRVILKKQSNTVERVGNNLFSLRAREAIRGRNDPIANYARKTRSSSIATVNLSK